MEHLTRAWRSALDDVFATPGRIRLPSSAPNPGAGQRLDGRFWQKETGLETFWVWTLSMAAIRSAGPAAYPIRHPVME